MSLLKEVRTDNTERALELLQSPQDLNQVDPKTGNSLLHFAVKNQNTDILRELLQSKNATSPINVNIPNTKDVKLDLPPIVSALNLNFVEGVTILLQHKADTKFRFPDGRSLLHFAAASNTPQVLEQLLKILEFGTQLNALSPQGTPLIVAVSEGQTENALFLIERKDISLEGVDEDGDSVFHVCASEGAGDVLNAVIQKIKADKMRYKNALPIINSLNKEGNAPIHVAALNDRQLILYLLIDNAQLLDIDLELKNKAGLTYQQILNDQRRRQELEKEELIQRKKQAQEEKNKRSQQRRQDIIEQNAREEEEKKQQKVRQAQAQEQLKSMDTKTRILFIGLFVMVLVAFYIFFDMAVKKKQRNIIE